jgi:imidazolonepropionase-like amidohydrolase
MRKVVFSSIHKSAHLCLLSFLLTFFSAVYGTAQNSDAPKDVTRTFYLKNINVIQKPGAAPEKTNIILKNGLIESLGINLTPPAEAMIIAADSLYAYPGFIDAFSHTGIIKPESKDQPKVNDPGNPPNDVAGITPQKSVHEVYKSNDKTIGELRSAGFTMAHVSPRGLMLPGQTSLIHLNEGETDAMTIKKDAGMTAQFITNRGVYPSTIIGVMAKFRELYKNAEILGKSVDQYNANPVGLQRPAIKNEEWALVPVTRKKMPVFFVASTSNQMYRALQLQKELGYNMVLTDVKQGHEMTDELKKQGVKIILSLDIPEEPKEPKEEKSKDKEKSNKVVTEEEKIFEEKRKMTIKEYVAQAAMFEKAGIPFSFACLNAKTADIHKNIHRMVKEGLSEKAALEALTVNPAGLLGVSSMTGTIEKGKIANVVITDKNYFDEKAKIKYVFVEGKMYDFPDKVEKAENNSGDKTPFSGSWAFTVSFGNDSHKGTLQISSKNNTYNVSAFTDDNPNQSDSGFDIVVKDNNMTFTIAREESGQTITYDFDIFFDTLTFKGQVSAGEMGSFPITGEKKSPPKSL